MKRTITLYAVVMTAYLTLIFLLLISYQLDSYWGSRVLLIVLCLNFLVPLLSLSMVSQQSMNKLISTPGESDRFLSSRGKNRSFKEAQKLSEFWLFLFSFSIIVGLSRMVDQNATIISLYNAERGDHQ